jgi:hypothetical protein
VPNEAGPETEAEQCHGSASKLSGPAQSGRNSLVEVLPPPNLEIAESAARFGEIGHAAYVR